MFIGVRSWNILRKGWRLSWTSIRMTGLQKTYNLWSLHQIQRW